MKKILYLHPDLAPAGYRKNREFAVAVLRVSNPTLFRFCENAIRMDQLAEGDSVRVRVDPTLQKGTTLLVNKARAFNLLCH